MVADGPLYPQALGARGVAVLLPDTEDRIIINRIIFEELVDGVINPDSRQECLRVVGLLAKRSRDAVALVCTEVPLLLNPAASPLPRLDSTCLVAYAEYDVATGNHSMPTWRGGPT